LVRDWCAQVCWVHLEVRELASVERMAHIALDMRRADSWRGLLSVEVEKPALRVEALLGLLGACDAAFLSRDFVQKHAANLLGTAHLGEGEITGEMCRCEHGQGEPVEHVAEHLALRCLRALLECTAPTPTTALWVVPWGAAGAFALHVASGQTLFEPAVHVDAVDSVGAGDTFVAASIHALARSWHPSRGITLPAAKEALRFACAVAGRKVSQQGFEGLGGVVPLDG
jgi:sugar/nucleoside kinase (ribokinase family)